MTVIPVIRYVWLAVILISASIVHAQDINFDDLKRQGKPLSKTVMITGLAEEAKRNLSRFDEIDSSRVVQHEASTRAAAYQYETQGKAGEGQFTCTFRCQVGGLGEIKGPFTYRFSGATRTQAREELKKGADALCRKLRGDGLFFKNQTMSTRDENCE